MYFYIIAVPEMVFYAIVEFIVFNYYTIYNHDQLIYQLIYYMEYIKD